MDQTSVFSSAIEPPQVLAPGHERHLTFPNPPIEQEASQSMPETENTIDDPDGSQTKSRRSFTTEDKLYYLRNKQAARRDQIPRQLIHSWQKTMDKLSSDVEAGKGRRRRMAKEKYNLVNEKTVQYVRELLNDSETTGLALKVTWCHLQEKAKQFAADIVNAAEDSETRKMYSEFQASPPWLQGLLKRNGLTNVLRQTPELAAPSQPPPLPGSSQPPAQEPLALGDQRMMRAMIAIHEARSAFTDIAHLVQENQVKLDFALQELDKLRQGMD